MSARRADFPKSEPFFEQLTDEIPHMIWLAGPDGETTYHNRKCLEYSGFSPGDPLGRGWERMLHADDLPRTLTAWDHSVHTGEPYEVEQRLRRHDGTYRWHISRARAEQTAAGAILRWVGTSTDIDDLKRARETVLRGKALLACVVESAGDAIVSFDLAGNVLSWNKSAERLFGYPAGEIIGRPVSLLTPPEGRDVTRGKVDRLCRGEDVGPYETLRMGRDGRRILVEVTPVPVRTPDGSVIAVAANYRDVTARRLAEETLRLRNRAIQAVNQGILITDPTQPDNPIIYASPGFLRLTGYDSAEVVGRNARFLQGKDTDPGMVLRLRTAVRDGESCTAEMLNYRKDGKAFWNEVSVSPIRDEAGRVTHFVGVQADISDRRKLEEQFRQSQKMEAVGQLAAGVAHDFNNLLTVINGYSEIMMQSLPPEDPNREMAEEILNAGERSAGLTRQLLAFSRQQILAPKALDLNAAVADIEKLLQRLIGEHIRLTTVPHPELRTVRADPSQIEQVILNLCVNARDAMPAGGQITIETRNVELDPGYAELRPEVRPGRYVMLAVSDTGHGMSQEVMSRIFEPFFTTKVAGKGTGLGLATVFGVIKQSGGHVAAYSEVGIGTTFRVYLPEEEMSGKADANVSAPPSPVEGTETVLLAEDEDGLRALTRRILAGCGYSILEAADGEQALHVAAGHAGPIHLLVTDVVMPGTGGRGLAERLAAIRPGLKVLYLSGYTDDAVVRHGILHEQVNFLQKPFSPALLARKVRDALDGVKQAGSGETR
ncbi:hybrid sensor histidine kinase/response regulator [Zavarzinella formosa]|uniref:hybrid sensor histidine kinase/response regulator n=1 Tax=Zavarzinella formosa TaxID=360055 RepID=UPI0003187B6A|nr:PAS domain-containing sensor histidine kinase [Zavarzinella formosa]